MGAVRSLVAIVLALAASAFAFSVILKVAPQHNLEAPECKGFHYEDIFVPSGFNIKDPLAAFRDDGHVKVTVVRGWKCLRSYSKKNPEWTAAAIGVVYVPLKIVCVPGGFGMILAVLAGALLPMNPAWALISVSEFIGSLGAYHFYSAIGAPIAKHIFDRFSRMLADRSDGSVLSFAIFLRVTPVIPNWAVNAMAPILGIPFREFVIATLVGVLPGAFLSVTVGHTLTELGEDGLDLPTALFRNTVFLFFYQGMAVIPYITSKVDNWYYPPPPGHRPSSVGRPS